MSSPTIDNDAVVRALRGITAPGYDRDVLSLGFVQPIGVADGQLRVTFQLPPQSLSDAVRDELTSRTTQALSGIAGVQHVIVDFTAKAPQPPAGLPGVKHVIAVGAGKGGVGKSTVAVLLAAGLQRQGLKVGILDADVYGPSLPKLTGTEQLQPTADPQTGDILPPEFDGIKIMSMGYLVRTSEAVIWRGPMAQKYVKEFIERGVWGELDYLIVDLPPGTGDIPLTLSQAIPLTGAVIVCTPQDVALLDASKAVRMYQKLNVPTIGMIENMSYYRCPRCGNREEIFSHGGAREAAEALGVPFLGDLPLTLSIRVAGDQGQPFACFTDADAGVVKAAERIVSQLVEEVGKRDTQSVSLPQLNITG